MSGRFCGCQYSSRFGVTLSLPSVLGRGGECGETFRPELASEEERLLARGAETLQEAAARAARRRDDVGRGRSTRTPRANAAVPEVANTPSRLPKRGSRSPGPSVGQSIDWLRR